MSDKYNCPRCGRDEKHGGLIILCQCRSPLEDEEILRQLNFMLEEVRIRPHLEPGIVDKTCMAITAYMRGRESRR